MKIVAKYFVSAVISEALDRKGQSELQTTLRLAPVPDRGESDSACNVRGDGNIILRKKGTELEKFKTGDEVYLEITKTTKK